MRPAIAAQLHADGDAPVLMPDASIDAGRSQYSEQLRSHTVFGATPGPSFPFAASSASASGQRSPKRLRSPTKAMRIPADLHMADIPILSFHLTSLDQVPSSMHGLVQAMKRIRQGRGTILALVAD